MQYLHVTYTRIKYEMNTLHIRRRKLYWRGLFSFLVHITHTQAHGKMPLRHIRMLLVEQNY